MLVAPTLCAALSRLVLMEDNREEENEMKGDCLVEEAMLCERVVY